MNDFEDYGSDTPNYECEVCGDPLCPGCGSSVQSQMLKLASLPVGILIFAFIIRAIFFGGSDSNSDNSKIDSSSEVSISQQDDSSIPLPITPPSSQISSTTSPQAISPIPISAGSLTEETIKSIVQVVQVDAFGPCAWGSGTVVGNELTVLTNFHVIESISECPNAKLEVWTVSALDERPSPTHNAVVLGKDETADLAILRLTPKMSSAPMLRPAPIRSGTTVGEEIFIIGFPNIGGSSITISKGIVSGYTKSDGVSWIKTDASISGGNSGGAAVNTKGELIGVPTMASASEDGDVVDCRPVADTNGDDVIDKYDSCTSIGGFLNLLSPSERAESLLQKFKSASVVENNADENEEDLESDEESADWETDDYSTDPRFATCKEARSNGYGPYFEGTDPEYNWYIDADNDGEVCER